MRYREIPGFYFTANSPPEGLAFFLLFQNPHASPYRSGFWHYPPVGYVHMPVHMSVLIYVSCYTSPYASSHTSPYASTYTITYGSSYIRPHTGP